MPPRRRSGSIQLNADFYAYMLGNAYDEMGRYEEAVTVLKRTIAAYPNLLVAHLAIIVALCRAGPGPGRAH